RMGRRGFSMGRPLPILIGWIFSATLALAQPGPRRCGSSTSACSTEPALSGTPPSESTKEAYSTTCALRGSSRPSAFIASSSATRVGGRAGVHYGHVIHRDMRGRAPAFPVAAPRMCDQNAPHHLGQDGEEVGAILPLHSLVIHPGAGRLH